MATAAEHGTRHIGLKAPVLAELTAGEAGAGCCTGADTLHVFVHLVTSSKRELISSPNHMVSNIP